MRTPLHLTPRFRKKIERIFDLGDLGVEDDFPSEVVDDYVDEYDDDDRGGAGDLGGGTPGNPYPLFP